MNSHNDWARWSDNWKREPVIDTQLLRRRTRRKLWRMRIVVTLELLVTLTVTAQLIWFLGQPDFTARWKIWAGSSLLVVASVQILVLHIRRGTWRASADTTRELLVLGRQRALAAIGLVKLNIWSMLVVVATTLLAAEPYLDPQRWQHDPHLKLILVIQFAVNAPIVIGSFVISAWYICRQRRKIRQLDALLQDEDASNVRPDEASLD